jgi:putative membrane protein insertion efficiency factor
MSVSSVDGAVRFESHLRASPEASAGAGGTAAGPAETTVEPTPGAGRSLTARILLLLFRGYQLLRVGRVSPCRFTPTCSAYAIEAVERHGAARGAVLAARRLGRCRPGGPSGYDPVAQ